MSVYEMRRHPEINVVSNCGRSFVSFRMIGLNHFEKILWGKKLASLPGHWNLRKTKSYECLCCIESRETAGRLEMLLDGCSILVDHGLSVSLLTYRDNDGLRLGSFVADFYRRIGGSLEFSIESGL